MKSELEANIRLAVPLGRITASGFETLKCPLCQDHKVRAGFKFDSQSIGYHCFRGQCGAAIKYQDGGYVSKEFRALLNALNVEIPAKVFLSKTTTPDYDSERYQPHQWKPLAFPSDFTALQVGSALWNTVKARRVEHYTYYVGLKNEWKNRLIIPHFYQSHLIGWLGVSMSQEKQVIKYLRSSGNTDLLFLPTGQVPKEPIIVEGAFDALSIPKGVGTLHSKISKKQAYFLRNSDPIVIPDKKDSRLLECAERYQWRVSLPPWRGNDPNSAVRTYGKLVVCRMIYDGLCHNHFEARLRFKEWARTSSLNREK